MSMNLHFQVGRCHVSFPYQTSTDVTYAVMDADSREEQLAILKKDCAEREIDHAFKTIEYVLEDPNAQLDYM